MPRAMEAADSALFEQPTGQCKFYQVRKLAADCIRQHLLIKKETACGIPRIEYAIAGERVLTL